MVALLVLAFITASAEAAYALMADRLAFAGPSLWLRSGCELVTVEDRLEWVNRGGTTEAFTLSPADAVALFALAAQCADEAGLALSDVKVALTPTKALAEAIDFSLTKAEASKD